MSDTYLLYIGKDIGFLYGVPARNLTEDEAFVHGERRLIDSGLYKLARPKEHYRRTRRAPVIVEETNKEGE